MEPNWFRLASSDDWVALWEGDESPLRLGIEERERWLHNTANDDYGRMLAAKHQLAAFYWLRDLVKAKATARPSGGGSLVEERKPLRQQLREMVLPGRLG